MINKVVWDRLLAVACAVVLCGILWAGLWPFNPHPKNQLAWLKDRNGLDFAGHATVLSSATFPAADSRSGTACSLEIWAQAGLVPSEGTLLGFYSPENLVSFSLHQFKTGLFFQRRFREQGGHVGEVHAGILDAFHPGRPAFITITANPPRAAFYLDGILVDGDSRLGLSSRDLTGQLVIANSPVGDNSWRGELRGLAIFDRELSAAEVLDHFNSWTKNGRPEISGNAGPIALYLFNERSGSVIHNRAGSAPDLTIPDHYLIFRQPFLERPWEEFKPTWNYAQDILVNIGGFIPFGFAFCAYFSSVRRFKRARLITILSGFAVSITIEVLQAYLPTRGSGMTDIITNTTGTAIGAALFHWKITQALFSEFGFPLEH
jgi:VanZ family protein